MAGSSSRPELLADLLKQNIERGRIRDATGRTYTYIPGSGFLQEQTGILLPLAPSRIAQTGATQGDALVAGATEPAFAAQYAEIEIILNMGGPALLAGIYMDIPIPFACSLDSWTMYADQSCTARMDLWSDIDANFPPTVADTMPNSNATKPQTAAAAKGSGSCSAWTKKTLAAGDVVRVNLDLNNTATRLTVGLKVRKT